MNHVIEKKVSKGEHKVALTTGNYTLCFDNSFSVVTTKTVEFQWEMPHREIHVPTVPSAFEFSLSGEIFYVCTLINI